MRLALVSAAALAFAACDGVDKAFGPSDDAIRASLAEFYSPSDNSALFSVMILPEQLAFKDAKVLKARSCDGMGAMFFCVVEFQMPDGKRVTADVHFTPSPEELHPSGWSTTGPLVAAPSSPQK